MAPKTPKNLLGIPKRSSGKDLGYQKNQNMVQTHEFSGQNPKVIRVKTDGRIGSATPHSELKGGFTVDNNKKVQPHHGPLGSVAAAHMSNTHEGGKAFQPRVQKARSMAKPNPKTYANPVNVERGSLKHVKPD
jgi:hypothetical protein